MKKADKTRQTETDLDIMRQTAMAFAGIGLYRYAFDGTVLYMDGGALAILELEDSYDDPSAVVGKNVADLVTYARPKGLLRQEVRQRRHVHGSEYPFRTLKGTLKWGLHDSYLVRDPQTGQEAIQVVIQDITQRKQTEEALRASERRFRETLESIHLIAVQLDARACITFCNDYLLQLTGWSRQELLGKNWFEVFVPPEKQDEMLRAFRQKDTWRGEVPGFYENPILTRTGDRLEIWWSNTLIRDEHNNTIGATSLGQDVTDRKKAEEALRASEAKYRELVENANSIILRRAVDGRITFFNEYAQRFFGYSEAEILGKQVVGTIVPETDSTGRDLAAMIHDISRRPERYEKNENENILRNGERVWIAWTNKPIRDDQGNVQEILCIGNDVTVRKRAEQALRESEEKYRDILENMQEGYYETDLDGNLTFFNKTLCEVTGYPADELLGMNYRRFYGDSATARKVWRTYYQVFRTGIPTHEFDWEIFRKDGAKRTVEISVALMRNDKGEPTGFRGLGRDVTARKEAEKALRESEAQNRALLDAMPDTMIQLHEDGTLLAIRPDKETPPDALNANEFLSRNIREVVPKEAADQAVSHLAQALSSGSAEPFEFALARRNVTRDYEARIVASGENEALAVVRDITERRQAEEALRQSETRYRTLFEACRDAVFVETLDGRILDCNAAACSAYGRSKEEMLHLSVADLVPEEVARTLGDIAATIAETGEISLEAEGRRKDGSVFPTEVNGLLCEIENRRVAVIYVRDIAERKRAEEALRESEERYRELFENANDIVYTHDLHGRLTGLNKAGERLSGYTREEAYRLNALEVVAPEYRSQVRQMVERKVAGEPPTQYELELITKSGERLPLEVSTRLIYRDGRPAGVQGIARDITERRRAEEERGQLEAQVQHAQKLESLGILAGGIAHDFNNLLVGILGNAGLALKKLPPESPVRVYAEKIEATAQRAAELTNQMLAYSGKGTFVVRPLSLSRLAGEMAHLLEASISRKATLKHEFEPDLPLIEGDAAQLQQVIMNLITNASDAIGDEPGIITLRGRTMRIDEAYLSSTYLKEDLQKGTYVALEVSDTGCGMDLKTQSRIFDPFFTTKFAGRGLGLAAVLGIARSHRGTIKIYSEPGHGTTFRVLFPALPASSEKEGAESRPGAEAPELETWRGTGVILVADDREDILDVATETLSQFGFSVLTASDGREALNVFKRHADEIVGVLLDLTMPIAGGDKVFEDIHRLRPDVPVILTSGYTEQDVTSRFTGEGPAGFIQKPYLPNDLVKVFRQVLTKPH